MTIQYKAAEPAKTAKAPRKAKVEVEMTAEGRRRRTPGRSTVVLSTRVEPALIEEIDRMASKNNLKRNEMVLRLLLDAVKRETRKG